MRLELTDREGSQAVSLPQIKKSVTWRELERATMNHPG